MRQNTEKREKKECHQLCPMSLNFTEPRQEDRLQCHMWFPQTLPFLEAVEKDCYLDNITITSWKNSVMKYWNHTSPRVPSLHLM